jgi:archaellum component FlaC
MANMITSDRQLSVTKKKIKSLKKSVKENESSKPNPLLKASMTQIKALIQELQKEIDEYENRKME